MRRPLTNLISAGIFLSASSVALAGDGILGTKAGGGSSFGTTAVNPVGPASLIQLAVVLGLVLVLVRYALPKAVGLVGKRLVTNTAGGLKIEESASFAGGNLYVVRARHKTLLLSVAASGVACLADLTESSTPGSELPTFQEMLESAPSAQPAAPVETDSDDPFEAALARLDRLDRMTQQ